jgi:hypothetical protein
VALAAVLTVGVGGHEDTGAAGAALALTTKASDLAIAVNLVELEGSHLDLLALVLDLLGGGVVLLLALLATHTTAKAEDKVEGGLLLNVVVREGAAVLELLASEDKTLLVGRDTCEARHTVWVAKLESERTKEQSCAIPFTQKRGTDKCTSTSCSTRAS